MKYKRYFIVIFTLFISFISLNRLNAIEIKNTNIELNKITVTLARDQKPDVIEDTQKGNTTPNTSNNSSSGGGAWCEDFNQVWYIFGIIIQVIYVVTPLLLIVTGSITMINAMMQKDAGAIKKAQSALVNKIIAAVVIFLMVSIVKMVVGLVATDGWTSCANCAFNPSGANCGIEKVPTGE